MSKCYFSGFDAKIITLASREGVSVRTEEFGEYWISRQALRTYFGNESLSRVEKLVCLQEIAKLNTQGLIPFWLTNPFDEMEIKENQRIVLRLIDEVKSRKIDHQNKDTRILKLLAENVKHEINPFEFTFLNISDRYSVGVFLECEYASWINNLYSRGLVELTPEAETLSKEPQMQSQYESMLCKSRTTKLTVEGWNAVHKLNDSQNSKNVFIAMAFTDNAGKPLPSTLRDEVKGTLEKSGWTPIIVDEVEHNDGIMDKVIASINESKFVIAELTHQKSGVYYEAGFAKGKGLQVIHIVNKNDLSRCHFDVKHLNLIVWENYAELSDKLKNRIKATIT